MAVRLTNDYLVDYQAQFTLTEFPNRENPG
jgi:hypothetical protein